MYQDQENPQEEKNEGEKPYAFSDETTKNKIKRHLKDINDVISENDIKNVKIPGGEDETEKNEAAKVKENEIESEEEKKKFNKGTEGKPATPWDIVD
jgi:hypothetical protein